MSTTVEELTVLNEPSCSHSQNFSTVDVDQLKSLIPPTPETKPMKDDGRKTFSECIKGYKLHDLKKLRSKFASPKKPSLAARSKRKNVCGEPEEVSEARFKQNKDSDVTKHHFEDRCKVKQLNDSTIDDSSFESAISRQDERMWTKAKPKKRHRLSASSNDSKPSELGVPAIVMADNHSEERRSNKQSIDLPLNPSSKSSIPSKDESMQKKVKAKKRPRLSGRSHASEPSDFGVPAIVVGDNHSEESHSNKQLVDLPLNPSSESSIPPKDESIKKEIKAKKWSKLSGRSNASKPSDLGVPVIVMADNHLEKSGNGQIDSTLNSTFESSISLKDESEERKKRPRLSGKSYTSKPSDLGVSAIVMADNHSEERCSNKQSIDLPLNPSSESLIPPKDESMQKEVKAKKRSRLSGRSNASKPSDLEVPVIDNHSEERRSNKQSIDLPLNPSSESSIPPKDESIQKEVKAKKRSRLSGRSNASKPGDLGEPVIVMAYNHSDESSNVHIDSPLSSSFEPSIPPKDKSEERKKPLSLLGDSNVSEPSDLGVPAIVMADNHSEESHSNKQLVDLPLNPSSESSIPPKDESMQKEVIAKKQSRVSGTSDASALLCNESTGNEVANNQLDQTIVSRPKRSRRPTKNQPKIVPSNDGDKNKRGSLKLIFTRNLTRDSTSYTCTSLDEREHETNPNGEEEIIHKDLPVPSGTAIPDAKEKKPKPKRKSTKDKTKKDEKGKKEEEGAENAVAQEKPLDIGSVEEMNSDLKKEGYVTRQVLFCSVCNIVSVSEDIAQKHIKSEYHLLMAAKIRKD